MSIQALSPEQLRRTCLREHFHFTTTAELKANGSIIGQPRGTRAIEFGIAMPGQGYNIFVVGETGTGRTTAIQRFLKDRAQQAPTPPDWVYVHNFASPYHPRAISLPAGLGATFKADIETLMETLKRELPKAFANETYRDAMAQLEREVEARRNDLVNGFEARAAKENFTLVAGSSGLALAPVANGSVMKREAVEALPADKRQALEDKHSTLRDQLDDVLYEVSRLEIGLQGRLERLSQDVAATAVEPFFQHLQERYADLPDVCAHLQAMAEDVVEHQQDFLLSEDEEPDLRRYSVNLFVDQRGTHGSPVVVERNPIYANLMGRIEHELYQGLMMPHFTALRAGSLHRANGGYLILYARDLLRHYDAWEALRRALEAGEIRLQLPEAMQGGQMLAQSLEPEPIPLEIKILVLGSEDLYYIFYDREEEFGELFKVKADFDSSMPRDEAHELEYASFIADRCCAEGLRHFHREAVEKIVEFGSRLADDQNRLSARFGEIANVIREANYWAGHAGRETVSVEDVQQALQERIYRANRVEQQLRDQILQGDLLIATEGAVVGQVNGLTILDLGDYAFGQPGRITARTYMGEDGVVNIEREVDMAGPLHNKGLLTLIGYLGGTYAKNQPLSLSASLTFEQNYMEVDGDSASAAELYALLSSLSGLPARQDVAVTGSINQHGEMQPVGGVTEKIEGFFAVCKERGLTAQQGVLIPAANVNNLMLREEVVEAVRNGVFHVWAVNTVDEGMELLLGQPAGERNEEGRYPEGTVHHAVQKTLQRLALELKSFGDHQDDD